VADHEDVEQQAEDTESLQLKELEKNLAAQAGRTGKDVDVPGAIAAALSEYESASVRSFVPVFVERTVRERLGLPRGEADL
jgi:hypothetical protein